MHKQNALRMMKKISFLPPVTFYTIITAMINVVKFRNYESPAISAAKVNQIKKQQEESV